MTPLSKPTPTISTSGEAQTTLIFWSFYWQLFRNLWKEYKILLETTFTRTKSSGEYSRTLLTQVTGWVIPLILKEYSCQITSFERSSMRMILLSSLNIKRSSNLSKSHLFFPPFTSHCPTMWWYFIFTTCASVRRQVYSLQETAAAMGCGKEGEATLMARFSAQTLKEQRVGVVRAVGEDCESESLPLMNPPIVRQGSRRLFFCYCMLMLKAIIIYYYYNHLKNQRSSPPPKSPYSLSRPHRRHGSTPKLPFSLSLQEDSRLVSGYTVFGGTSRGIGIFSFLFWWWWMKYSLLGWKSVPLSSNLNWALGLIWASTTLNQGLLSQRSAKGVSMIFKFIFFLRLFRKRVILKFSCMDFLVNSGNDSFWQLSNEFYCVFLRYSFNLDFICSIEASRVVSTSPWRQLSDEFLGVDLMGKPAMLWRLVCGSQLLDFWAELQLLFRMTMGEFTWIGA